MSHEISQQFFFDAAHTLQRDLGDLGDKSEADSSRRLHGHTYNAEVFLAGKPDPRSGMVVDLGRVRLAIAGLRETLDHRLLDDVAGLGPATLENLCSYIWRQLAPGFPSLSAVRVWRVSSGDGCTLRGDPDGAAAT
ncbi:MAG: 6-carboxytetrahydropterin synthase [Comamonadaceae bacterium]|nr:MAG: 6-carboxytetrahydropterin synthase [Comamonadaceae bacterium]